MRIRDLLDRKSVSLTARPINKEAAINQLVDLMEKGGCLNDSVRYRAAVFDREAQGSTGFGEGVAIPHAKSAGVSRPGLAAMVVHGGVDFDATDGKPVDLLFMIASPHQASDAHLDVLARLSTLLIDEKFRDDLRHARSVDEFLSCIDAAERKDLKEEQEAQSQADVSGHDMRKYYDLVAVTACPAGLSHTYMAAEALEHAARDMGISIKVEADGAAGNRNRLLPEDIAHARAVIVAADRAVEMDRFLGKRMVRTGVGDGVHKARELIERALDPDCPEYKSGGEIDTSTIFMRLYRHLMSGLTYILPLAATAGVLSAVARLPFVSESSYGLFLETIGYSIGTLLFPVLSAFIAFSIAGRTALVAGFTGGVMADMAGAGVIGALLNGFVGGGVAFAICRVASRFLKGHDAIFALLVYPLLGATLTTLIAQFVTSLPSAWFNSWLENFILQAPVPVLMAVGAVLGGMMAADMGGPFNKLSYATGVLLLADCLPESGPGCLVMAAVMTGGMIPPLAAGTAALLCRKYFSRAERAIAVNTVCKGLLFITEGVLPYLQIAPYRMRFACILGSATGGALIMLTKAEACAPHGGIFIAPLSTHPVGFVLSLLAGTLMGALLMLLMRLTLPAAKKRALQEDAPLPSAEPAAKPAQADKAQPEAKA